MVGDDVVERMARALEQELGSRGILLRSPITPMLLRQSIPAALAALGPELCIVPRNPTRDMRLAGARSIGATMGMDNHMARAESAYDAMLNVVVLAAAPSLPHEDAGDE